MYDKISREIMVEKHFGCNIEDIAESVIVSPVWSLDGFISCADAVLKQFEGWYDGVTLSYKGKRVTVVNSHIGAPMTGDCVLALQYSNCRNVIFSGSAGAINPGLDIGDFLIAGEAVIGEGFSRYHRGELEKDCFGETAAGDQALSSKLLDIAKAHEQELDNKSVSGRIFSTDSILGETREAFEYMTAKGCDAIEMEVSAVFTACRKAELKGSALIIISDLPLKYRSLFDGITDNDKKKFQHIRAAMPGILLEAAVK